MAIEIVDFPMANGDFPWQNVSSPEGNFGIMMIDDKLGECTTGVLRRFFLPWALGFLNCHCK